MTKCNFSVMELAGKPRRCQLVQVRSELGHDFSSVECDGSDEAKLGCPYWPPAVNCV